MMSRDRGFSAMPPQAITQMMWSRDSDFSAMPPQAITL
jgi:hypothetical protein